MMVRKQVYIAPLAVALFIALFGRDEVVFLVFTASMVLGGWWCWQLGLRRAASVWTSLSARLA
jgi:hypothetical protein